MISKDNALELCEEYGDINNSMEEKDAKEIVSVIYDSVGSCSECKYVFTEELIDKNELLSCLKIRELVWGEVDYKEVSNDWYCADFKRKET